MHVALMTWSHTRAGAGLSRAARLIAKGLHESGCDVTLLSGALPFGAVDAIGDIGIRGCAPPKDGIAATLRKRMAAGHLVAPHFYAKALQHLHQRHPVDVIEATNWYAPAALARLRGVPLVIRCSTPAMDAQTTTASLRDRADLAVAHWLEARTARRADGVISNTASHRDLIAGLYRLEAAQPHAVIDLAIDDATLTAGSAAGAADMKEPVRLLFVGRDERRKGLRECLGGFALLQADRARRGCAPLRLTIVGLGRGDLAAIVRAESLPTEILQHIDAVVSLSDDALRARFAAADIVLAPSRYESYGLVYREAAAFARPLIACAEDPSARAFVSQARCGILSEACKPMAIHTAVARLLDDPDHARLLGCQGRDHVQALTTARLGRETLAFYERLRRGKTRQSSRRVQDGTPCAHHAVRPGTLLRPVVPVPAIKAEPVEVEQHVAVGEMEHRQKAGAGRNQ
ncbi:glycosyltransferase family 4 protein [Oceaniglobus indicus]|uniref:glycosyltransferase family 4 protein n=1 Tax=Oceaniglobus indicus TaxID=2047749 RepID=UPI000C187D19|nr:glycosyltransferase family 4 protein [Oceaniglobus indicus]